MYSFLPTQSGLIIWGRIFFKSFCQNVRKNCIILIEYTHWPITSTLHFVLPLFWYQRNHCISPRRRSYARLNNVVVCVLYRLNQQLFHFLVPFRRETIRSAALLGYKFNIAFLISSSVISLIKSLFCSSPTLGRVIGSKKDSSLFYQL